MSASSIDIVEIFNLIPHRYPFILIDKILEYKTLDYLYAIKNVTINEPFFNGHFPGKPIMPGVLIIEALAQASAVLSTLSRTAKEGYKFMYLFAGINNARFKQVVTPGDTLRLEVKITTCRRDFWVLHGEAFVGEKLACAADLMTASKEVEK